MVCFLINPVLCWSLTVVEHVFEGEKGEGGGGGENQECVYVCVWGGGGYTELAGVKCVLHSRYFGVLRYMHMHPYRY